jgi:predicted  nucleic acid-binding Zn-ribbon protein
VAVLEGLNKLVDLQGLDSQLTAFEEEHSAIPTKRGNIVKALARCDERLETAREQLKASGLEQRRVEQELQEKEALLQRLEGQQNQVKSNDAYTALLHEMEQARQAISICETGILEGMDAAESAKEVLATEDVSIATERTRLGVNDKALADREEQLATEIASQKEARAQLCSVLESKLLGQYQKVLARRQPALVLVTGEMCTGCRVGIPAQDYIEVLKAERIITCQSCARILLHPEKIGG